MSHTPGPWEIDDDTLDVIALTAGDAPAYIACQPASPAGRQLGEAEVMANVQLIAAAPDMLDALRTADDALDYAQAQVDSERDRERLRQWRTRVQNVIALAEGR